MDRVKCGICQDEMLYLPYEERGQWWYDSYGELHQASLEEAEDEWVPYERDHIPLLVHEKHVFHRHCIKEYLEIKRTPVGRGSIYNKIFSIFLPCIREEEALKGNCPLCRADILSSHFVENTALTTEVGEDEDDMPVPERYDPDKGIADESTDRRTMMEIAFLVTVLYVTAGIMAFGELICLYHPPEEELESNHFIRAANYYKLSLNDFAGFEDLGRGFFPFRV